MSVDLDHITDCPLSDQCQGCGTTTGLVVCTAHAMSGVLCLTLCQTCDPPVLCPTTAVLMTRTHAMHLGIDPDQMATEVQRASAPGCLWCTRRPAPYLVYGDPLCLVCYRAHRNEVTR